MAPKSHVALVAASLFLTRYLAMADCNLSSNQTSIESPSDASSISTCSTIDGALSLLMNNDGSSWSSSGADLDLGTVSSIDGGMVIYPPYQPKKTTVSASKLKSIGGDFTIWNPDTSNNIESFVLNFPALTSVTKGYALTGGFSSVSVTHGTGLKVGKMMRIYSTAPLSTLDFGGLQTTDGDFSVDTNTDLKTLTVGDFTTANQGFALQSNDVLDSVSFPKLKTVNGDINIYQNSALKFFSLSALEYAETITYSDNADSATVYFPALSSLGSSSNSSTTISSASEIMFSALSNVTGAISFTSIASEELSVPLVKTISESITVTGNSALTTFSLPRVSAVGDIAINTNDKLTNFTANALKTARTISLKGSFTNVEFFGLKEVTGDFKVVGSDSMDCYWFDENVKSIVKGKYSCVGNHDQKDRASSTGGIENTEGKASDYYISTDGSGSGSGSGSSGDSGSGGSSGSGSGKGKSGLSTAAMAGVAIGAIVGVVLMCLAGFFFWRRRRENPANPQRRVESRDSDESRRNPFDGAMLGVHTKIEAQNPSPSPSLGALSFGRNSFLDASGAFADKTLKTIRRVSASSSGGSDTLHERERGR